MSWTDYSLHELAHQLSTAKGEHLKAAQAIVLEWYHKSRDELLLNMLTNSMEPYLGILSTALWEQYIRKYERSDLYHEAYIGLLKAIEGFDPVLNAHGYMGFTSYARATIIGTVRNAVRDRLGFVIHVPQQLTVLMGAVRKAQMELPGTPTVEEIAAHLETSPEKVQDALIGMYLGRGQILSLGAGTHVCDYQETLGGYDSDLGISEQDEDLELFRALWEAVDSLDPKYMREIIRRRFVEGKNGREIAGELGISEMHVSRLLRKATALLRVHPALLAAYGQIGPRTRVPLDKK